MNTDKKVFNKLFSSEKVELASERYEFAFPDIKGELNKADGIYNSSIEKNTQLAGKASEDLIASTKPLIQIRASLNKSMEDFKNQYKELIGQSADSTQQVKDFTNAINKISSQVDQLTLVARKISQSI
jgi:hypothetical protein